MQIKTAVRHQLTLVRMAIFKKTKQHMLERVWRKGNPSWTVVGGNGDLSRVLSKSENRCCKIP